MVKMRFRYLFFLPLALIGFSCSDSNDVEQPDDVDQPKDQVINLSAEEMANCYIVQSPGIYKFKADNQFNLGPGLPVPPEIFPSSATLVWQTQPGSITEIKLIEENETPYIQFNVTEATGNALLAALDDEGNIVWSWHIWMPSEKVSGVAVSSGYEVMNMNLGAMNNTPGDAASYGMLYQWGRKDPFPASETLTGTTATVSAPMYDIDGNPVSITNSSWYSAEDNTIEYAIAHPTVCLSSMATSNRDWLNRSDDSLWGNPEGDVKGKDLLSYPNKGSKTCYDPSPAGWRVAPVDAFAKFTSTGGYVWEFEDFRIADVNNDGVVNLEDYNYGWFFLTGTDTSLYFPAASRFDGSYAMLMGSMSGLWGNYWSNSPYSSIKGGAFCGLSFMVQGQNGEDWVTVSPAGGAARADAYSVRCVRDQK